MSYGHPSLNDRYVIHHLRLFGVSRREIARRLGRHHSAIGLMPEHIRSNAALSPPIPAPTPRRRGRPPKNDQADQIHA